MIDTVHGMIIPMKTIERCQPPNGKKIVNALCKGLNRGHLLASTTWNQYGARRHLKKYLYMSKRLPLCDGIWSK